MPGNSICFIMKIQFFGQNAFRIEGKGASFIFDPNTGCKGQKADFMLNSGAADAHESDLEGCKKAFGLPGEFEISDVLVTGYFSDTNRNNVMYLCTIDEMHCVHTGNLDGSMATKTVEQLGENVDVLFVNLSSKYDEKMAKKLMDTLAPRYVFVGGDEALFPKITAEANARAEGEDTFVVNKSALGEDKMEILLLPKKG